MANGMEHIKTDCSPDFSGIKHTPTKLNKGAMVMLQDCDYQMPQYLFSGQVALVTFLKQQQLCTKFCSATFTVVNIKQSKIQVGKSGRALGTLRDRYFFSYTFEKPQHNSTVPVDQGQGYN